MNKLKIEHLKGYLGTGLKIKVETFSEPIEPDSFSYDEDTQIWGICYRSWVWELSSVKPILKPMEMFDKKEYDQMMQVAFKTDSTEDVNHFKKMYGISQDVAFDIVGSNDLINYLYQNHYDIHGLIEKCLAVDWREYNK